MIATNIEQSTHLLELGLDPKTADCHWWYAEGEEHLHLGRAYDINELPAWSLSALLEVMPNNDYWDIYLCQAQDVKWQSVFHDCEFSNGEAKDFIEDDPITAAYEMVCWLLENNLIKKGGEE